MSKRHLLFMAVGAAAGWIALKQGILPDLGVQYTGTEQAAFYAGLGAALGWMAARFI